MAVSRDHSYGPVPGPDQESQQPKPWPGPGPDPGLAWLPLQCQTFPSEPRSWAEMAGGPGLLPGSLPASQAPGQGCNHSGPGGRRGETGQAGPPGQATGGMLPCCGLSTRLGRAVCQGLQVPAWIPAPSQGTGGSRAQAFPSPDAPASPPPDLSSGGLGTPALPTLPGPPLAPRQQGLAQVLDRTPAPGPNAAAPLS